MIAKKYEACDFFFNLPLLSRNQVPRPETLKITIFVNTTKIKKQKACFCTQTLAQSAIRAETGP